VFTFGSCPDRKPLAVNPSRRRLAENNDNPMNHTSSNTRRNFLMTLAAGSAALTTATQAQAQAAKLNEKDPQAVALGYFEDATKTDTKKYPKYAAGQLCNNCALYQGKATDAWGGCPLFAGKQVAGKGWCSAWAKKG
jgi:hypothetical protein